MSEEQADYVKLAKEFHSVKDKMPDSMIDVMTDFAVDIMSGKDIRTEDMVVVFNMLCLELTKTNIQLEKLRVAYGVMLDEKLSSDKTPAFTDCLE